MRLFRLWPWLMLAILAGCIAEPDHYDLAMVELERLETAVDSAFDAARDANEAIFAKDAWNHPDALEKVLSEAGDRMDEAVSLQDARIAHEREMLELKALEKAPETRELYHLDISAQEAKLVALRISLEMYGALCEALRDDDAEGFESLKAVYQEGVNAANQRFRERDMRRQQRQRAMEAKRAQPI
ncbi:MAG: hypothetical protein ACE5FN_07695 [Leptospirillia bacterium]